MRNPYQRKAAKTQNNTYNAQEIYKQFVEMIVGQGYVHALYDDGWALCATPTGQRAFAIWQSKGLAKLLVKDNWENYQIQEISLKDFVEKVIPFTPGKHHRVDGFNPGRAKCAGCTGKIIIGY